MATLGDYLHSLSSFWTLQRSDSTIKAPMQTRGLVNPVTHDSPSGGFYSQAYSWQDERRARLALQTSWSYSAIGKIGMAALGTDLEVKRRIGEDVEDIKNHPIELLALSPNPDMSQEYFWLFTITSLYLHAAYWFLYPDGQGNIAEIWPMPFHKVRPIPDDSPDPAGLFKGFAYRYDTGKEEILRPENVVYLRFPDPLDQYGALPPMRAFLKPVLLDNAQSDWNTNLFDGNKGLPASIVGVPPELTDEQYSRVKAELKEQVGKRMVTRSGAVTVEFMQETHKEMEFLSGREFNRREIYEVLGVPLEMTNESWRWFINVTVWPVLTMIAGQITTQLVKPFFGDDIFATFKDIRPQDRSLDVQEAVQYWPSFSLNETRETRGMKPFPPLKVWLGENEYNAFEDLPVRLLERLVTETASFKEKQPPPPQLAGFTAPPSLPGVAGAAHDQEREDRMAADTEDATEETTDETDEAMKAWQDIALKRLSRKQTPGYVYLSPGITEAESYRIAAALGLCQTEGQIKAVFSELDTYSIKAILSERSEVDEAQLELEDDFIDPLKVWLAAQAIRAARRTSPDGTPPDSSFWTAETVALTAFLVPYVSKWVDAGISSQVAALSTVSLGIDADVNARAAVWAGKYAGDLAKSINTTTRELTKSKIKQWLLTGEPLSALETSLGQVIAPQWRASLIASTEVTRSWAQAAQAIGQELGVVKKLVIQTARDERVCPICGPKHGTMVSKDSDDIPPFHPRCRCGVTYSL